MVQGQGTTSLALSRKQEVSSVKRVLFVCTGNVCRSPMAAGLLRHKLVQDGLDQEVDVTSAGVYALDDQAASQPGVAVLGWRGIDIRGHRAHTIGAADVTQADLVLVMEEAHRRALFYSYPHLLGKIFLLSEMSGDYREVRDPYRRPMEEYERCANELDELIDSGYDTILRRLKVARPPRPE